MKYIVRELIYFGINLRHILCSKKLKIGFRAKATLHSRFEGYNKLSHHSFFSGELGYASYIGEYSVVEGKLGRYCSVAGNVIFLSRTHPTTIFVSSHPCFYSLKKQSGFTYVTKQKYDEVPKLENSKYSIIVGNDVYIGYGVTIIGPVRIGDGAVIAANSTVTHDVPPYVIVGGTPARPIKSRFSAEEVKFLLDLKWWNKDIGWIKKNAEYFRSVQELKNAICHEEKRD